MSTLLTLDKLVKLAPQEIKDYLDRCAKTPQSPEWHPEGDVLIHIKIVYERARRSGDVNLTIAALFHDLGKADTTSRSRSGNGWSAYGHEHVSAKLVEKHKKWIGGMGAHWFEVYQIVKDHMRIKKYDEMRPGKQEEFRKNPLFNKLLQFSEFDNMKTLTAEELNI
jgi:predicted HD phosphohydrolase